VIHLLIVFDNYTIFILDSTLRSFRVILLGVMRLSADDVQTEILQRLTRVETKLDMQLNAKDLATEALDKAKSAHHRIDDIADTQKWLWRTIIGAIILAAVAFIIKGGLAP
jgi:hypothetical protein